MNKTAEYTFTVLVPFYNEEDNILNIEREVKAFMAESVVPDVCVLFVNDGSKDNSLEILKNHKSKDNRIKIIDLKEHAICMFFFCGKCVEKLGKK